MTLLENLQQLEFVGVQPCLACGNMKPEHWVPCPLADAIATVEKLEALASVRRMCNDPYCEPCTKGGTCKPDVVNAADIRALLNGDAS